MKILEDVIATTHSIIHSFIPTWDCYSGVSTILSCKTPCPSSSPRPFHLHLLSDRRLIPLRAFGRGNAVRLRATGVAPVMHVDTVGDKLAFTTEQSRLQGPETESEPSEGDVQRVSDFLPVALGKKHGIEACPRHHII